MINNVIKFFIVLCALLLVILAIEWWIAGYSDQQAAEEINRSGQAKTNQTQVLQEVELARQAVESYSEMTERPLFIEGRKPVLDETVAIAEPEVGKIDDWVLIGIYVVEDKKTALFSQRNMRKTYQKKSEGEDISGWKLEEIKNDRVTLVRSGSDKIVMLRKPRKVQKPTKKPRRPLRKPRKPRTPRPPGVPPSQPMNPRS